MVVKNMLKNVKYIKNVKNVKNVKYVKYVKYFRIIVLTNEHLLITQVLLTVII